MYERAIRALQRNICKGISELSFYQIRWTFSNGRYQAERFQITLRNDDSILIVVDWGYTSIYIYIVLVVEIRVTNK